MSERFNRVVPAANTLADPGMCDDSKHHTELTSNTPSHRMMNAASGSLAPLQRLTRVTADELPPRVRTGSPENGRPVLFDRHHDVGRDHHQLITIANNSERLIDKLFVDCADACSVHRRPSLLVSR